MIFSDIRKKEGRISGLVALERALPRGARAKAKKFIFLILPFVMMGLLFFEEQSFIPIEFLYAVVLLGTAAWLIIFMLDCFYYAHYFEGAHFSIHEWGLKKHEQTIPFEVLEIISHTHAADLTAGFLKSRSGSDVLKRLNISHDAMEGFLATAREKIYTETIVFPEPVTLSSYAATVYDSDAIFSAFLSAHEVEREEIIAAASWISAIYERKKEMFRWWGRDSLGRIKAVGKEWAKTETSLLERFGTFAKQQEGDVLFKKEIDELEKILAREAHPPILLIADKINKLMSVISGLTSRIEDGFALPQIAHKEILILDIHSIDEASTQPGQFEILLTELFSQALESGDLILVFNNFPAFMAAAQKHKVDPMAFLAPYLSSPDMSIVAFSLDTLYEKTIRPDTKLLEKFARLFVECEDQLIIIRAIEHAVFDIERVSHTMFTYQAVAALAEKACADVAVSIQENRALNTLKELLPKLVKRNIRVVTADHVAELTQ